MLFPGLNANASNCNATTQTFLKLQEFNRYDIVVKAKLIKLNQPEIALEDGKVIGTDYGIPMPQQSSTLKLRVLERIKGTVRKSITLTIMPLEQDMNSCRSHELEEGKTYYFFAFEKDKKYVSDYSTRVFLANGEVPAELGLARYKAGIDEQQLTGDKREKFEKDLLT